MQRKTNVRASLDYLHNKPKIIRWEVVAGPKLHPLQMYDLIFDNIDLRIRKIETIDLKIRKMNEWHT